MVNADKRRDAAELKAFCFTTIFECFEKMAGMAVSVSHCLMDRKTNEDQRRGGEGGKRGGVTQTFEPSHSASVSNFQFCCLSLITSLRCRSWVIGRISRIQTKDSPSKPKPSKFPNRAQPCHETHGNSQFNMSLA